MVFFEILYRWRKETTSVIFCCDKLGMGHNQIVDCPSHTREICDHDLLNNFKNWLSTNNEALSVSFLMKLRRWTHVANTTVDGKYLNNEFFGGICRENKGTFFMLSLLATERLCTNILLKTSFLEPELFVITGRHAVESISAMDTIMNILLRITMNFLLILFLEIMPKT